MLLGVLACTLRGMEDLEIKCASVPGDVLTCHASRRNWSSLRVTPGDGGGCQNVHLSPETAQELVDWLTEWIEQSKLVCGWARVEDRGADGWRVFRPIANRALASFASRELAVAWVEALTAEVRK